MKHLKNALFLVGCLLFGFGVAKAYLYWKEYTRYTFEHHEPTVITGVGDAPTYHGFALRQPPSAADLKNLLNTWYDLHATSFAIEYSPSWTAPVLAAAVKAGHARQFTVVLQPEPVPTGGNPYPKPLTEIAADAQAARVDMLCVSWLNTDPPPREVARWRDDLAAVRKIFTGKLILAARPEVVQTIDWWDAADYLGVAGPVELPRRLPHDKDAFDLHDWRVMWDTQLTMYDSLYRTRGRKIALLNLEVPEAVATKLPIPGQAAVNYPADPLMQAKVYEALLMETKGRSATIAMMLLPWEKTAESPVLAQMLLGRGGKVASAWDPQKPRAAESQPAEAPDADGMNGLDGLGGDAPVETSPVQ